MVPLHLILHPFGPLPKMIPSAGDQLSHVREYQLSGVQLGRESDDRGPIVPSKYVIVPNSHQILNHFFAQVMIDTVELFLLEQ